MTGQIGKLEFAREVAAYDSGFQAGLRMGAERLAAEVKLREAAEAPKTWAYQNAPYELVAEWKRKQAEAEKETADAH